jgi:predicted P-loop ATPase
MTLPSDPPALILPGPDTPVVEAAEMYVVQLAMAPLMLYGIRADGGCMCDAGMNCPPKTRGKHPIGNAWNRRASTNLDEVRDRFRQHRGNIGLHLAGSGRVLLDADTPEVIATVESWGLPPTLRARSGSGVGAHWLLSLGPGQDAGQITDRKVLGVDIKIRGQFVVAPSRHTSGGYYEWVESVPIAALPDDVYAKIRRPVMAVPSRASSDDPGMLEKRARAYMAKIDPAISGSGGHDQCFAAARTLAGFVSKGLPESVAQGLLGEYNATCQPPWSERELAHKWKDAKSAHTKPLLADRPRPHLRAVGSHESPSAPAEPPGGEPDWRSDLLWSESRSGQQKLVSHLENVVRILQRHPDWKGKIRFDEFRSRIVVSSDAPWDGHHKPQQALGYWTDNDTTRLNGWLRTHMHGWQFDPSITDCERAVGVVSRTHDFNPVRDYLDSVSWDGISRLSRWTSTYLGAEDTEYHRLVGAWWLISAVARIYQPGCKVDTVPILEGAQGIRKSSALRVLAGAEFFNDTPIDLGNKDAYTAIQGCWIVELAELESLMRAEPSRSKAFFSSSKDRFRRAYARHESEELRQCIFVGTVNLGEYLSDPTGARRFWPIRCSRIDLEALEKDRDQLWAEAVREYQDGRVWYPTSEAERGLLEPQQEGRTKGDAWESLIGSYLTKTAASKVSTGELLEGALRLDPKDWTTATQTRVGILMLSRFGWLKRKATVGGQRVWLYERPVDEVGQAKT